METNITYNFDAFEKASEMMSQCVTALSKKNARQQIAAMAMQAILNDPSAFKSAVMKFPQTDGTHNDYFGVAQCAVAYADALIAELNKKKDGK